MKKPIKIAAYISTFILAFTFLLTPVLGASLSLTKIGALDTAGKNYTEWWYLGSSPLLMGTAGENASVVVKVNDTENTVTADGSGNWSYQTALETADYTIAITSGEESMTFTLHMGQEVPATTGETEESTSEVPMTGFNQYIAMGLGVGVILLASYLYVSEDNKRKSVFETRLLDED